MKVLLDLIPLKRGGGQQVGLNFVEQIERLQGAGHTWRALVTRGSALAQRAAGARHWSVAAAISPRLAGRMLFERAGIRRLVRDERPDIVFSLFGAGLPRVGVPTVVGSAYSNLYHPEIDFWGNWPAPQRWLYRLRDVGRLRRTMQADALIFETDGLARQAAAVLGWEPSRLFVVRPSPSAFVTPSQQDPHVTRLCASLPEGFRVLLLTGWHENKGLRLLPLVARAARDAGFGSLQFVITVDPEHPGARQVREDARALGVEDRFSFIGPVPSTAIAALYTASNAVLLLSVLESFSNNIAEAWVMERPLVITDASWARDICGPGAVYVDRANPAQVAAALVGLASSAPQREAVVRAGRERLARHPDAEGRFRQYVEVLEQVLETTRNPEAHP